MCDFWTTLLSLWCKSPVCVISATVCLRHSTAGRLRLPCLCVSVEGFVPWSSGYWPLTGAAWRPSERLLSCCWHCCWTWRRLSAEKSWELLNVSGHNWAEINPNCSKPWTRLGNVGHSSPRPLWASKPFNWAVCMSIKKVSLIPRPLHILSIIMSFLESRAGGCTVTFRWRVNSYSTVVNHHLVELTSLCYCFNWNMFICEGQGVSWHPDAMWWCLWCTEHWKSVLEYKCSDIMEILLNYK